MLNYTRNGWERRETTLETSGEVVNLHSKRVAKMWNTLETSGEDVKLHSKRVEKIGTTYFTAPPGVADRIIKRLPEIECKDVPLKPTVVQYYCKFR